MYNIYTFADGSKLVCLVADSPEELAEFAPIPTGCILNLETYRYVPLSVFEGAELTVSEERPQLDELTWFASKFIGYI